METPVEPTEACARWVHGSKATSTPPSRRFSPAIFSLCFGRVCTPLCQRHFTISSLSYPGKGAMSSGEKNFLPGRNQNRCSGSGKGEGRNRRGAALRLFSQSQSPLAMGNWHRGEKSGNTVKSVDFLTQSWQNGKKKLFEIC